MDILTPADFAAALKAGARLLGIDPGTRTIGLAVATFPDGVPTAIHVIRRTKFMADKEQLLQIAAREGVAGLVLGLPLNMDGTEGPRAQSVRAFARSLSPFTPLPLLFQDERLSTVEASGRLRIAGFDARRQKNLIDAAAAAVILEDALAILAAIRR